MTGLIRFGRKIPLPTTVQIRHELRLMAAADELVEAGIFATPGEPSPGEPSPDAAHHISASDLAQKHGLSLDRAEMLIARFGANQHTLESAAQTLPK